MATNPALTYPDEILRLFMLALCVWREARGEPMGGKLLVAQTIENRVKDARWPRTVAGVVTQRMQFSSFNLGDPNSLKFPDEGDVSWPECVAAAQSVLDASHPYTTANHYHTLNVRPTWADPKKIVATVGNHVFYCL